MKPVRPVFVLLAAVTIVALVAIASCSKSNSSNPTSPGGGGGGGLELNSGNIPGGGGFAHTFANAGSFGYHCAIHGNAMAGTVNVSAGSSNDSMLVTIGPGLTYTPATTDVKPGGQVRWINTGVTHTVTSN